MYRGSQGELRTDQKGQKPQGKSNHLKLPQISRYWFASILGRREVTGGSIGHMLFEETIMNVIVRVVASLIATMLFVVAASAAPWKGNIGVTSLDASANKVATVQSTVTVYQTPDGRYSLSASGNEVAFNGYAPGTPGTFPARVNEDGTVTLPVGKRLLTNPNFAVGRVIYNELTGTVALTGTRKLLEVVAPTGGESGSYRLVGVTTSYVKAEELVASTPNAFVSQYGWAVPAEVKAVWVTNNNPADSVYDPVRRELFGSFISAFDLATNTRRDIVTQEVQRRVEFNQSEETAITPAGGYATMFAKSGATPVATDPVSRIAAVPYEPTGKVVHVGGGSSATKMWLFNSRTGVSDFSFFGADLPQGEGNLQILVVDKVLFRVVGVNNFTTSRVYLYSMENGAKLSQFDLPFKVGQASEAFAFRPELSFSPAENMLYVVAPESGKLYRVNVGSGVFTEIPIPQAATGTFGASDVEVDTSKDVIYVTARGFAGAWLGSASVNGKVFEFPCGSLVPARSVGVGVAPWQLAVGKVDGVNTLFITNSADSPGPTDTISRVETASFTEVLPRQVTLEQPTGIAVQLK